MFKGFRLDINIFLSGLYMFKFCRVMVEILDGNWVNYGVFDCKSMDGIVYISFKKLVECIKVCFENMMVFNGRFFVDVNEVIVFW